MRACVCTFKMGNTTQPALQNTDMNPTLQQTKGDEVEDIISNNISGGESNYFNVCVVFCCWRLIVALKILGRLHVIYKLGWHRPVYFKSRYGEFTID